METKSQNIIEKYLDTKQKKIVAGCLAGVLVIGVAGAVVLNSNGSKDLVFTSNEVDAEFGQKVSTNVADYLDANKVDNLDKIIKDTKEKDNLKYVTVTNKDEQGNVVSKEEKDYPKVGNYEINFTYKKEKQSVKVTVKDTKAPEITAPDSIDVIQYTDLSTFNFGELLQATDYSDVKDWKIDTSKVDVNTMEHSSVPFLSLNEIARVVFTTAKELFFDPYRKNKSCGSFILIDPITNNTSAVGMIIDRVEKKDMNIADDFPVLNLPELGIAPEHYEAIEKAVKSLSEQGFEVRIEK